MCGTFTVGLPLIGMGECVCVCVWYIYCGVTTHRHGGVYVCVWYIYCGVTSHKPLGVTSHKLLGASSPVKAIGSFFSHKPLEGYLLQAIKLLNSHWVMFQ